MIVLVMVFGTAGCISSYAPSVRGAGPAYQADLATCQEQATTAVNKRNAKTGLAWFSSPFRAPFQVRPEIRDCLKAKGYTLES